METVSELYNAWLVSENKIDARRDALKQEGVDRHEVETLLRSEFKDQYENYWFEQIIKPIIKQIEDTGKYKSLDVLGPNGLGCRVIIWGFKENTLDIRDSDTLTLEPDLEAKDGSPLQLIDRTVRDGSFEKGTIGYINGLDHPREPIDPNTSGEDWLALFS
ncbi:hypothetical protein [Neptuniibacter sp. QD37_11]|uniref:hypothetical protein n=1 Tax=Neptuniibacter sp. QD37_11 TaxID=3398209 RepID=UPI0039F467AA